MPYYSNSGASMVTLGRLNQYGEGYKELHLTTSHYTEMFWTSEEIYNDDADDPFILLDEDNRMVIQKSGLYDLRMMVYGYGNGETGINYAQGAIQTSWTTGETLHNALLGFVYVDLSGVDGEKLSPWEHFTVPLEAGMVLTLSPQVAWNTGPIPSGTNFQLDAIFAPLFTI